ncbi:hypothetical protein ACP70R_014206 [Stipagrostis hirtigluma subsp. patula]
MTLSEAAASPMVATATATSDSSPFEPCVWNDFFITYTPPASQRSEEWMRERADQLKAEVRRTFESGDAMSTAGTVTLVDALERLGIDIHFHEEIDAALSRVHSQELELGRSEELHIVALRFRLLRQHGFWVSPDVFDKFRDGNGSFRSGLSDDPRGLLSLYNAAHMAVPGEDVLDEAIAFARRHLEAMRSKLTSPMAEQVSRSLDIPLPRFTRPLDTVHYVTEYEQEEAHNAAVLELARLELSLMRSAHLKELRAFCIWWRDLYHDVKLNYTRDRAVELYFWASGVFLGEGNAHARIVLAKTIALSSLMDDTYDVRATVEECEKFDEAIQRWDERAVSILPKYLQMLYLKTLSTFHEFKDALEPNEKYRVSYVQKAYKLLSKYYLQQAKWSNENYMPSFKDHVDVSTMSSGAPMLTVATLMVAGDKATKEAFEWASSVPDMVHAGGEIGRFLNDIPTYKRGKNKKDQVSSLECYMNEHGAAVEEASAALYAMTEHAWRRINRACMEIDRTLLPGAQLAVVSLARTIEIIYLGGNDAYTFSGDLQGLVASLFLKPVPV